MKSLQYLSIGQNTTWSISISIIPLSRIIRTSSYSCRIHAHHVLQNCSFISTTSRNVSKQIIIYLKIDNNISIVFVFFTSFLPYKNRFEISFLVMTVPTRNEWWCRSSQHPGKLGDQNLGEIFMGRLDKKFLAMKKKDLRRYSSKNIGIPMGYIYILYIILYAIYILYTYCMSNLGNARVTKRTLTNLRSSRCLPDVCTKLM